jgi:hypothetical protein
MASGSWQPPREAPNASTVPVTLAVPRERDLPNERRPTAGQSEHIRWEGHEVSAGPVKTFRHVGDVEMNTADL